MAGIDMWDFRLYVRECLKMGQADEIIKILIEENIIPPIPQGEWIDCKDIPYLANCSHCGYQMDTHEERGYFKFCPYCGADMRGKNHG